MNINLNDFFSHVGEVAGQVAPIVQAATPAHPIIQAIAQAVPAIIQGMTTDRKPAIGHVGNTLYADNVRILFINGVGSREEHCREKAQEISKVFGNCRVDYCYVPMTFPMAFNAISEHKKPQGAELVVRTLRKFEDEVRHEKLPSPSCKKAHQFLEKGERIICIVHSGGGATLESVKHEIPLNVREIMDVFGFGSAQYFLPNEFGNVRNIVAANDPIPRISSIASSDPEKALDATVDLVPVLGEETFVASHQFLSQTYQEALKEVHEEYEQERKESR